MVTAATVVAVVLRGSPWVVAAATVVAGAVVVSHTILPQVCAHLQSSKTMLETL